MDRYPDAQQLDLAAKRLRLGVNFSFPDNARQVEKSTRSKRETGRRNRWCDGTRSASLGVEFEIQQKGLCDEQGESNKAPNRGGGRARRLMMQFGVAGVEVGEGQGFLCLVFGGRKRVHASALWYL